MNSRCFFLGASRAAGGIQLGTTHAALVWKSYWDISLCSARDYAEPNTSLSETFSDPKASLTCIRYVLKPAEPDASLQNPLFSNVGEHHHLFSGIRRP